MGLNDDGGCHGSKLRLADTLVGRIIDATTKNYLYS